VWLLHAQKSVLVWRGRTGDSTDAYHEQLSELDGFAELSRKDVLLDVARRVVIVVIEADFAPFHAAGMSNRVETVEDGGKTRIETGEMDQGHTSIARPHRRNALRVPRRISNDVRGAMSRGAGTYYERVNACPMNGGGLVNRRPTRRRNSTARYVPITNQYSSHPIWPPCQCHTHSTPNPPPPSKRATRAPRTTGRRP
jgi:hypothetical protein